MNEKIKFDAISDIHLDFWAKWESNMLKNEKALDNFIEKLLPENKNELLIIAGDLGHTNKQNKIFLEKLSKEYKKILLVPGNHDYYMVSRNISGKFNNNSIKRWENMKELINEIDNVIVLEGDIYEYQGIKFGGCGMWYDFTFSQKVWGHSYEMIKSQWKSVSNDSVLIKGLPFRTLEMFEKEKNKFESIIDDSDILITHVPPDFKQPPKYAMEQSNSFYYFNGDPYIDKIENKLWLFGHTHERYEYEAYGCKMMCVPLGYKGEFKEDRKIINIEYKKQNP